MNNRGWTASRLGSKKLITAVVLLAAVGAIFATGQSILSPGPLSAQAATNRPLGGVSSHAQLSRQCGACHAPPWSSETMAQRCLACHASVAAELQTGGTLHGMLLPSGSKLTCKEGCHVEHRGATSNLTAFGSEHSPLNNLGYSLKAHQTGSNGQPFTCLDCHQSGVGKFDEQLCYNCHRDIDSVFARAHLDAFGTGCLQCHDGIDTYGKAWNHNAATFKLSGKHGSQDCVECHGGAQSISQLKASPQACNECHQKDDTHQGTYGKNCAECHNTLDWKQVTVNHSQTTFPLTGKHITADCASCHPNNVFSGTPDTCFACHQKKDTHQGSLGQNCGECHNTNGWTPASYNRPHRFPTTHGKAATCKTCHPNNLQTYSCYGCHKHTVANILTKHRNTQNLEDCVRCHPTGREKGD